MEKAEKSVIEKQFCKQKRRSFFSRMLLVIFLLVVTSLTVMGFGMRQYKADYYQNALRACDMTAGDIASHSAVYVGENVMDSYAKSYVNKVANQMGIFIFLFDTDGKCVMSSDNVEVPLDDLTLNTEMLSAMEKNGSYLTDRASGKFDQSIGEPMLCRGISFVVKESGKPVTYYMFANSYTRPLDAYTSSMVLLIVVLIFGMLVISAVFISYSIHTKSRQMEQLLTSMRQYAQGEYHNPIRPEQYVGTELEEVASLAETISNQAKRAEDSSRQFVSNVSHELRTPMTIIGGFVEGILDGTVPKGHRMEYLSIVSQEVQRLKMLVTSMLNLTKFDAGTIQLNYKMFTLNDTAFRTILMFGNRLEKRNVSVEGLDTDPLRVCADPDLIGQVMYNLVENAVKFVNESGTITFTFSNEEDEWVFAIRNTGNGISKEELPKIFERFYKSDASRSQDKTGLGLGLDITRRIIHLHHAQISVRSEEHAYTEFEVRLPHVEPPEAERTEKTK